MEPQGPVPQPGPQPGQNPPPGWYPDPQGVSRWWDGQQWGQPAPVQSSGTDPKTMAVLAQVLGILTGFLGPLIIYLVNGEKDPYVRHHSAEALNFQLTVLIAYIVSFVLMLVLIGFLLFAVVWVLALVFGIQAAIAANRGEWYRYPISIRMVSGAVG
jgi:uncharacterized Tic20 family protein